MGGWLNELWGTLRKTGQYKGKRLTERLPDKNHPIPGTRPFWLYQQHGLLRPGFKPAEPPVVPPNRLAAQQPAASSLAGNLYLNVVLPNMGLGGAERMVHDILSRLSRNSHHVEAVSARGRSARYPADGIHGGQVVRLEGQSSPARMRRVAAEVLALPAPTIFTHMVRAGELEILGRAGVRVVPVIHNSQPEPAEAQYSRAEPQCEPQRHRR